MSRVNIWHYFFLSAVQERYSKNFTILCFTNSYLFLMLPSTSSFHLIFVLPLRGLFRYTLNYFILEGFMIDVKLKSDRHVFFLMMLLFWHSFCDWAFVAAARLLWRRAVPKNSFCCQPEGLAARVPSQRLAFIQSHNWLL